VTTAPVSSRSPSNGWNPGTSTGAPLTRRWARTARVVWSIAASRWTSRPSRRAPAGSCRRPRPPAAAAGCDRHGRQPRAEHGGQRGGSTRAWVRRMVASAGTTHRSGRHAERRARPVPAGGVSGPLGDRGYRSGAGQDRSGGHGKDRDQRVPAAAGPPGVVDRGEVGEQTRGVGCRSASAWASWARAAGIEDDGSAGTGVHRDHEAVRTA
jgi:hypothetical protein